MNGETQPLSEQSVSSLVGGIMGDLQSLFTHQLELTRREIEDEVRRASEAASIFALGAGALALGAIELCLALSYLLHHATSPAGTDPAAIPLWACHAIIAIVPLIAGGFLVSVGRTRFKSIDPTRNTAAAALQDNVEWAASPK